MRKYVDCFDDECQCVNCQNEAEANSVLGLCKECLEKDIDQLYKEEIKAAE